MASRRIFWAAVWLALALVVIKATHLGVPWRGGGRDYVLSLAAITCSDVLFVVFAWSCGRAALAGSRSNRASRVVEIAFVAFAALTCLYCVASIVAFGPLGGFLTYPLLQLVGNVRMLGSSVATYLTARVVLALIAVPTAFVAIVLATVRFTRDRRPTRTPAIAMGLALVAWVGIGQYVWATDWRTHYDWRVGENPPWVLVSSFVRSLGGGPTATLSSTFPVGDLDDFAPPARPRIPVGRVEPRPPNVILIVLEAVSARWTSISGGTYGTTPVLAAEAARGVTFDRFYAHVGRSSDSLASMLLSVYPKLDFLDYTEEFPHSTQTSLAGVLRGRGYRTAFVTSSDMTWAGWNPFLRSHGFDEVQDDKTLPCDVRTSSWGLADRCIVDTLVGQLTRDRARPFFLMAWTQQTHHPYEPSPGLPILDLVRDKDVPDEYDLNRYLNVLHETDHELARLFEALGREGLADDTIVAIVGDHGQAFGYPHETYIQGRTVYQEDVNVPLLLRYPRRFPEPVRASQVGALIDLPPTIAELAGVPAAADWQGRSLFDPDREPRAYFYVAQDEFKLGVREDDWKYVLDLRTGVEELYRLDRDPNEQRNLARDEPRRAERLRQRLAAWTGANRRQYAGK